MYPRDNIFNIYYNIGKRLPFQVKRCEIGLMRSINWEIRLSTRGRTFMVERIEPKGRYGKAYGYCLVDNELSEEYLRCYYPDYKAGEIVEIPCAGCGEWVLIDVPNVDLNEIFPMHQPEEIIPFGKYKGKSLQEIYDIDPKYIFWLLDQDPYYTVNIPKLIGVEAKTEEEFQQICLSEYDRLYPKLTAESIIKTGKYKDKSFAEVALDDPNYIDWFLANTKERIDYDSFYKLKQR